MEIINGKPIQRVVDSSLNELARESGGNLERLSDSIQDYKITDKDDDASPNYYSFVRKDGDYYFMKETVSAGADTYRYWKGSGNYTTDWTNRAAKTYDYFNLIF